jgi:hypothetical protein
MDSQEVNKQGIDKIIFDILWKSKSFDIFPTPVDKIVQYCELRQDDLGNFHKIPKNYIPKNLDAFQRMMKKILGVFDREEKSIFIDPSLPGVKKNFLKLHEAGHGSLPWQKDIHYLDNELTLLPEVKELFEREASYFASGGLFQLSRFEDQLKSLPLEIGSPMALAKIFGGSNHAAFRRYAEVSNKRCSLLVLKEGEKKNKSITLQLRNQFQSPSFTKDFGVITWPETLGIAFPFVVDYSRQRRYHQDGVINLETRNGFIEFAYHYFHNSYNTFVLIIPTGEKNKSRTNIYVESKSDS